MSPVKLPLGANGNQLVSILHGENTAWWDVPKSKILWEGNVGETAEIHFDGPTSITVKYHGNLMHYGGECSGIVDPSKSKKYNVSARPGLLSTKIVLQPVDVFDSD